MNYKNWVHLNDEGMRQFGEVFPNGIVPVNGFVPRQAILGESEKQKVYIVDIDALEPDQFDGVLEILAKRFKVSKRTLEEEFRKDGLPIREYMTSFRNISDGAIRLRWFL